MTPKRREEIRDWAQKRDYIHIISGDVLELLEEGDRLRARTHEIQERADAALVAAEKKRRADVHQACELWRQSCIRFQQRAEKAEADLAAQRAIVEAAEKVIDASPMFESIPGRIDHIAVPFGAWLYLRNAVVDRRIAGDGQEGQL